MQTTRKAVRYYIDRDADTPVIRSVPVSRPAMAERADAAYVAPTDTSRRPAARERLASLLESSVRRHRRHDS